MSSHEYTNYHPSTTMSGRSADYKILTRENSFDLLQTLYRSFYHPCHLRFSRPENGAWCCLNLKITTSVSCVAIRIPILQTNWLNSLFQFVKAWNMWPLHQIFTVCSSSHLSMNVIFELNQSKSHHSCRHRVHFLLVAACLSLQFTDKLNLYLTLQ